MKQLNHRTKITCSFTLSEPVIKYLDMISKEEKISRSMFLDRLLCEHISKNITGDPK